MSLQVTVEENLTSLVPKPPVLSNKHQNEVRQHVARGHREAGRRRRRRVRRSKAATTAVSFSIEFKVQTELTSET